MHICSLFSVKCMHTFYLRMIADQGQCRPQGRETLPDDLLY